MAIKCSSTVAKHKLLFNMPMDVTCSFIMFSTWKFPDLMFISKFLIMLYLILTFIQNSGFGMTSSFNWVAKYYGILVISFVLYTNICTILWWYCSVQNSLTSPSKGLYTVYMNWNWESPKDGTALATRNSLILNIQSCKIDPSQRQSVLHTLECLFTFFVLSTSCTTS